MADADLRAFAYTLEPVRRQRQWQLDTAFARLGKLRGQVSECDAERGRLHQECLTQAALAARVWTTCADPAAQTGLLGYLAALQNRRADIERSLATLKERVEQARQACALQQQKLETLEQHRTKELKAFADQQHRKLAVQADQEWVARESYRSSETL